jgi:hypothetical protein
MASAMSFFGKKKQEITNSKIHGSNDRIDPIFMLCLDSIAQLVRMNPLSFEYKTSYLAFLAIEVHQNRFFEFV